MAVKRKLLFSARKSTKKPRTGRALLKRTNYTGDIVPKNLHLFGAGAIKPNQLTRACLRYGVSSATGGVTVGSGAGIDIALSNAVNYGDFTAVFDQYRIVAVEVAFMPYVNTVSVLSALQGRLFTAIDYDDVNAPASANAIRAYNTCLITKPWESCVRTLVPHTAEAAYSGAFTSFANKTSSWIDSASPGVKHYGVKYWAEQSTTTTSSWFVEVRLFVEFKNVRAT